MWTIVHIGVSLPLAFGINILLARILGVADYGRLAYLTMVMEIASIIVTAGVGSGMTQFGAKAHSRGDATGVKALLRRTQGFRVFIGAPLLTLVAVVVADVPPLLLVLAVVFGIWVPAAFGGGLALLTIQNRVDRMARLQMVMNVVTQAVVVMTVLLLPEPDAVWASRLVVGSMTVVIAVFLVHVSYRRAVLTPRWPSGMPSGFWRYAIPIGISGIVASLALNRSEVVLLEHLSTAQQVGLYAMAFGLAGHLFAPAQALLNPLTPAISALREVDLEAVRGAFLRTVRASSTIAGLIIALGGPTLALLVPLLYGPAFAAGSSLVLALVVVSGFLIVTYPTEAFVTARLRSNSVLIVNTLSLVAAVAVALLLIPWLGAWGAVLGKGAVVLARVAWLGWHEQESFMVTGWEYLSGFRAVLLAGGSALAAYAAGSGVSDAIGSDAIGAVTAALMGGTLFWVGLRLFRCGLHRGDVDAITGALPAGVRPTASKLLRLMLSSGQPGQA